MEEDANSTGCFFYWSRSKKVCLAFPFLLGILQSSTLRTFWAGPVKKPSCNIVVFPQRLQAQPNGIFQFQAYFHFYITHEGIYKWQVLAITEQS